MAKKTEQKTEQGLEMVTTTPMRLSTMLEQHVALQAEQKAINKALIKSKDQLLEAVKANGDIDTEGRTVYVNDGNQAMIFPAISYPALAKLDIVLTAVPKRYHRLIVKTTDKGEFVKVTAVKE